MEIYYTTEQYTEPIIKKYNPTLSERVILKKTAKFHSVLYHSGFDYSYTPENLLADINKEKDITKYALKSNKAIYIIPQYRTLRSKLANLFEKHNLPKLAKAILKYQEETIKFSNAKINNEVEKIKKLILEQLKNKELKDRITRLLARYLP